jgi:hypothetical protein
MGNTSFFLPMVFCVVVLHFVFWAWIVASEWYFESPKV